MQNEYGSPAIFRRCPGCKKIREERQGYSPFCVSCDKELHDGSGFRSQDALEAIFNPE